MPSFAFSYLEEKCVSRLFLETRNNSLSLWDALATALMSRLPLSTNLKEVLQAWCHVRSE